MFLKRKNIFKSIKINKIKKNRNNFYLTVNVLIIYSTTELNNFIFKKYVTLIIYDIYQAIK